MEPRIDLASYPVDADPLPGEVTKNAVKLFRIHGCLLIENVFPMELVTAIRDEFRNRYENLPEDEINDHCLQVGHKRYKFTVNVQEPFNDPGLYASPKLLPILKGIVGNDCVIHSFGAVCAFPGSEMQHFHQDHEPLYPEAAGLNAFLPPYKAILLHGGEAEAARDAFDGLDESAQDALLAFLQTLRTPRTVRGR